MGIDRTSWGASVVTDGEERTHRRFHRWSLLAIPEAAKDQGAELLSRSLVSQRWVIVPDPSIDASSFVSRRLEG